MKTVAYTLKYTTLVHCMRTHTICIAARPIIAAYRQPSMSSLRAPNTLAHTTMQIHQLVASLTKSRFDIALFPGSHARDCRTNHDVMPAGSG